MEATRSSKRMTRWEVDPESRNALLIRCVGHDYGPNPIERLDDIRRDRMRYASTIAEWLSIDTNDIVLDLGSGCGFMGRAIAPTVRHLHCADISPKFLAFCADELSEFPNVTTHLVPYGDLSSLRGAGITKIYSSAVFIHFNFYDIVIYLNALNEILPIGGMVFFDFLDPAGLTKARQSLFHRHLSYYFDDRAQIATLIQYNSLEAVHAAAELTGFRCWKISQMNDEAYSSILTKEETRDALKPMSRPELEQLEKRSQTQPSEDKPTKAPSLTPTTGMVDYLANMPLVHTWGDGVPNTGGFDATHLQPLSEFMRDRVPPRPRVVETGAGNSTIFFLLGSPSALVSIDPDPRIHVKVTAYCRTHSIDCGPREALAHRSEEVLPRLSEASAGTFDFALIDGDHGWPAVFVDFCYCARLLKRGGYLMIDDVEIYGIGQLVAFLREQPDFRLVLDLGKAVILEKVTDAAYLPGWWQQPFIQRRTASKRGPIRRALGRLFARIS
jgi:hypothetical protein